MRDLGSFFGLTLALLLTTASQIQAATVDLSSVGLRIADSESQSGARGLRVLAVQRGSTAFVAGFQPGDFITRVDGAPRLRADVLSAWIRRYFRVGDKLGITWRYVTSGGLSDHPINTALMIGRPSGLPWLTEVHLGQDVGRPFDDVRFYEHFHWPNRTPAEGVAQLIDSAGSSFSAMFEAAKAQAAELPCDGQRYKTLDEMGKDLVIAYYTAHGIINDVYTGILTRNSDAACSAKIASAGQRKPCGPTPARYKAKEFGEVLYSLESGCSRTLSPKEQLVMAGLARKLLDECGLPSDSTSKRKLERFLSPSTFTAMFGGQFSNPDLGEGMADSFKSSASYAAGLAAFKLIGCKDPGAPRLAKGIVDYLDWTASGRGLGASRFVEECVIHYEGRYDRDQCKCMADVGRAVRPDIHQGGFSPVILQSIIKSNPFVGMQLISRCGLTEY